MLDILLFDQSNVQSYFCIIFDGLKPLNQNKWNLLHMKSILEYGKSRCTSEGQNVDTEPDPV